MMSPGPSPGPFTARGALGEVSCSVPKPLGRTEDWALRLTEVETSSLFGKLCQMFCWGTEVKGDVLLKQTRERLFS